MLNILILFLISFTLSSMENTLCPPESMRVEYVSPVTGNRKMTCGYMKGAEFVKHGQEIEYHPSGNKIFSYTHGQESLPRLSKEEEDVLFSSIQGLLKIFVIDRDGVKERTFKTLECEKRGKTWVATALTKTSIDKKFKFSDFCYLSGSFTAGFLDEFHMNFKLRNMGKFKEAKMLVKLMIKQSPSSIRYRFEVREGAIIGGPHTINFKGEHEVDINPLTGSAKYQTEEGKITLTKIEDKEVNISRAFIFTR